MYKAPIPLGPYILCPDILIKSTPNSLTSTGMLPQAWTPSVCIKAPCACAISVISFIGCIVPISLLANITLTSIVLSLITLFNCSKSTLPSASTSK